MMLIVKSYRRDIGEILAESSFLHSSLLLALML